VPHLWDSKAVERIVSISAEEEKTSENIDAAGRGIPP